MTTDAHIVRFDVTNTRTGKVVSFKTRTMATKAMDRIDNAFGACCTVCKAVWSDQV